MKSSMLLGSRRERCLIDCPFRAQEVQRGHCQDSRQDLQHPIQRLRTDCCRTAQCIHNAYNQFQPGAYRLPFPFKFRFFGSEVNTGALSVCKGTVSLRYNLCRTVYCYRHARSQEPQNGRCRSKDCFLGQPCHQPEHRKPWKTDLSDRSN